MYRATNNVGLYLELRELINYVNDFNDELRVDYLLKQFKREGLTRTEVTETLNLIDKYLPSHIECDRKGCYIISTIEIESGQVEEMKSYIPEINDLLELPIEDSVIAEVSHRELVEV